MSDTFVTCASPVIRHPIDGLKLKRRQIVLARSSPHVLITQSQDAETNESVDESKQADTFP